MKSRSGNKKRKASTPEQVSDEEALARMRSFAERKEKFIGFIKKSADRDISAEQQGRS